MPEYKQCYHYWKIHKKFAKKLWDSLSLSSRELISSDSECEMAKYFSAATESEARRAFESEDYFYNNPATFKSNATRIGVKS